MTAADSCAVTVVLVATPVAPAAGVVEVTVTGDAVPDDTVRTTSTK